MKHILNYVGFTFSIFILFMLSECKSTQYVSEPEKIDQNKTVYWFYVYIREVKINDNLFKYELKRLNSEPIKGSLNEYERLLWHHLSDGSKFSVGPFMNEKEAQKALYYYKIQRTQISSDIEYDLTKTVFWFVLHINKRERSKSLELVRIPGAIASGNYTEFDTFLSENLELGILTIGPFNLMTEAEEAKRIYRLH